jgi:hypothetical protein
VKHSNPCQRHSRNISSETPGGKGGHWLLAEQGKPTPQKFHSSTQWALLDSIAIEFTNSVIEPIFNKSIMKWPHNERPPDPHRSNAVAL